MSLHKDDRVGKIRVSNWGPIDPNLNSVAPVIMLYPLGEPHRCGHTRCDSNFPTGLSFVVDAWQPFQRMLYMN